MAVPNILHKIIQHKHQEIDATKSKKSYRDLECEVEGCADNIPRSFFSKLQDNVKNKQPAVIAEIKKASPSKGVIREDFDPRKIAQSYELAGACCLSVLTDERFFKGHPSYVHSVKEVSSLPVLRKDFIVDPYQILESKVLGADCVLLIAACLSDQQLQEFYSLAAELQLDVLIEVHNEHELLRALALSPPMVGINNRDLKTFNVDLNTTFNLLSIIPNDVTVVAESGIGSVQDVQSLIQQHIYAFLVGEAFMRGHDPGNALRSLFF